MTKQRLIKDEQEIEYLERACELTESGCLSVFNLRAVASLFTVLNQETGILCIWSGVNSLFGFGGSSSIIRYNL